MVEDGRVLGQDGDAALALQLVGVHHALDVGLVGAEGAALVQHGVNQGGLSVVHVRDNGDVANTLAQNKCPSCWGKPRATRQTEGFGTDNLSLQYAAENDFTIAAGVG